MGSFLVSQSVSNSAMSGAGQAAASMAAIASGGVTSSILGPALRSTTYHANSEWPTTLPPIEGLMSAYNSSHITGREFAICMVAHGCSMPPLDKAIGGVNLATLWAGINQASWYRPDTATFLRAVSHRFIVGPQVNEVAKRYAIDLPTVSEMAGIYRDWPPIGMLGELRNRQVIDGPQYVQLAKHDGGYTDEVVGMFDELRHHIPPVTDLLHFAIREAFNDEVSAELRSDEEYAASGDWPIWLEAQGVYKSIDHTKKAKNSVADWSKLYWRSHWHLMSIGQGYEAFHRLRKNRLHLYEKLVPNIEEYTYDNLKTLMKVQDILPSHRPILAAMSYSTPRLVDLRKMWYNATIDKQEFIEYMKDRGLVDTDAARVADAYSEDRLRYQYRRRTKILDKYDNAYYTQIIDAFRHGVIDEPQLFTSMEGFLGNGEAANAVVNAETLRRNNAIVKQHIQLVRKQYWTGEVASTMAIARLVSAGIDSTYASSLVSVWQAKFDMPTRAASIANIKQWYLAGIIPASEAQARMLTIGVSERDITLHMLDLSKKKDEQKKKDDKKKAGGGGGQTNWRTPTKIAQWFNSGKWTKEQATAAMLDIGVPAEDVDDWLGTSPPLEE